MKTLTIAVLVAALSSCATIVQKGEFIENPKLDADWEACQSLARDLKARFGTSQVSLVECLYNKGQRLKPKAE